MKYFFITIGFLSYQFVFSQTGIENHFKIYNTHSRQITTVEQIAEDCRDADVLFFGEEHSDSAGHYLEAAIFEALHKIYGDKLALSMEMFETDCQLVVDEYLDGYINEDRLMKDARPWGNYKDYRLIVEFARQNNLAVIAANAPRRYVNMVSRKGMKSLDSLPKSSKKFLPPLPYDTATGRYREKFQEFMRGGSPGTNNPRIYYSQNLWDAGMSYSIYSYWKKNRDKKIFHMVGRFHSDEKLGTLAQLQKRKTKLKILNISCFSDSSFTNPSWEKFSHLGDYVIITDPDLKKTF
ncbi:MAG TPA: ChaN family lipoprotein [Chitinophagaceae bacterium]|nr:ChaN family lipoprotein [Chitinophagaceae bacterium]